MPGCVAERTVDVPARCEYSPKACRASASTKRPSESRYARRRGSVELGMAGYSGTPLPQKLGIKAKHPVAVLGAPKGFEKTLGALPEGVRVSKKLAGNFGHDVIVYVVTEKATLKSALPRVLRARHRRDVVRRSARKPLEKEPLKPRSRRAVS